MRPKVFTVALLLPLILFAPLLYLASWRPHKLPSDVSQSEVWLNPASTIAYGPNGDLVCNFPEGPIKAYQSEAQSWQNYQIPKVKAADYIVGYPEMLKRNMSRLDFSRDGNTLFAPVWINSQNMTIGAFDTKTRRLLYSFGAPAQGISAISPDGKWAAFDASGGVVMLDLTAKPLKRGDNQHNWLPQQIAKLPQFRDYPARFRRVRGNINSLAISPDSKTLAVGFNDQVAIFECSEVTTYDAKGELKKPRFGPFDLNELPANVKKPSVMMNFYDAGSPYWIEWSPTGDKLAVFHRFGLFVFDSKLQKRASTRLDELRSPIIKNSGIGLAVILSRGNSNVVWSKDGQTLLTGGRLISRWSLSATDDPNRDTLKLEADYKAAGAVAISPDDQYLLTNAPDEKRKEGLWRWKLR